MMLFGQWWQLHWWQRQQYDCIWNTFLIFSMYISKILFSLTKDIVSPLHWADATPGGRVTPIEDHQYRWMYTTANWYETEDARRIQILFFFYFTAQCKEKKQKTDAIPVQTLKTLKKIKHWRKDALTRVPSDRQPR